MVLLIDILVLRGVVILSVEALFQFALTSLDAHDLPVVLDDVALNGAGLEVVLL